MRAMSRSILFLAGFLIASSLHAEPISVEASGMAPGDLPNAREMALTDALREAVRKGVGVDILSSSKVSDFQLEYDRVFAASFGFVRKYNVTSARLDSDGLYRVTVKAEVGPGQPETRDLLALRQIVHLKGSPRVALETDELLDGVPAGAETVRAWFEQTAKELQLSLVDVGSAKREEDRLAARAAFTGDSREAAMRRADFGQKADFVVQVKMRGKYSGAPPYGMAGHVFALACDLRAIRPDTGEVVASLALPTREAMSEVTALEAAARDAAFKMLAGGKGNDGGQAVFRKIFAAWVTELDMGALMRLEFMGMTDAEHDALIKALGGDPKITAVWPREFDSRTRTVVDVESRLDAGALKETVRRALGGAFKTDLVTGHHLLFARDTTAGTAVSSWSRPSPAGNMAPDNGGGPPCPTVSGGFPAWGWAWAGAGVVVVLVGVFALGRKLK